MKWLVRLTAMATVLCVAAGCGAAAQPRPPSATISGHSVYTLPDEPSGHSVGKLTRRQLGKGLRPLLPWEQRASEQLRDVKACLHRRGFGRLHGYHDLGTGPIRNAHSSDALSFSLG